MIEVGDLVRFKNKHINANALILTRTRWEKKYKRFRRKQQIARVLAVREDYDWKTRTSNRVVVLDIPGHFGSPYLTISTYYLVLHRKHNAKEMVIAKSTYKMVKNNER
jgi:hypothetical protein